MAERPASERWGMRAAYVGLAALMLFAHLLPLQTAPSFWAGPDLLMALTFSWALRRPDLVPFVLVALVMLMADLLLQRPPGLYAVLVVLAAEWIKRQVRRLRENTFFAEWLTVSLAMAGVALAYRLVLALMVVPAGPLALALLQLVMTVLCYPVVTAAGRLLFGVRHRRPGEYRPNGRPS